jgi:hypothetical protein
MYSILKKCRNLNLPVDIQLELFDTMVLPVAMYDLMQLEVQHEIQLK